MTLPSGRKVFYLDYLETKFLSMEMSSYFQHGIEIRPGDIVFDVGANIGMFSIWVSDHYGDDVALFAFEPVAPIFDVLQRNLSTVSARRAEAFHFGLSGQPRTLEFRYFPTVPVWSAVSSYRSDSWFTEQEDALRRAFLLGRQHRGYPMLRWLPARMRPKIVELLFDYVIKPRIKKAAEAGTTLSCEVRTLSDVMREYQVPRIDLLKIDVEGSELDVLAGIADQDWCRIRQMVIEVEAYSRVAGGIMALLRSHGFTHVEGEQGVSMRELDIGLVFAAR
jgi:hypothetical protein